MKSVMDLSDEMVLVEGLKTLRGMILPKNNEEKSLIVDEVRLRLANSHYENVKKRLKKNKKVSEEELRLVQKDLVDAEKAMFK